MYEMRIVRERRAGYQAPQTACTTSAEVFRVMRSHFAPLDRE